MVKYVSPKLGLRSFTCTNCNVLSQQVWSYRMSYALYELGGSEPVPLQRCYCVSCEAVSFWSKETGSMIMPKVSIGPLPHQDLPEDAASDYMEARAVASDSPRSAAALLRLCIQKLLKTLGGEGKNIDTDIGKLVGKGLPPQVRDALDICRVVGNNAVHPGELNVGDDPELVSQLFELINFIVSQTIEREKALTSMLEKLPQGAREAMEKRNAKAIGAA